MAAAGDFSTRTLLVLRMGAYDAQLGRLAQRVHAAHAEWALPVIPSHAEPPATELSDRERHAMQEESISAQLREVVGLASRGLTVVEYGAGSGGLSRAICRARAADAFVLIERNPRRSMQQATQTSSAEGPPFAPRCICADVRDVEPTDLRRAIPDGAPWVVAANHMCGDAMDMAVGLSVLTARSAAGSGMGALQALLLVPCCHENCRWDSYLGRETFVARGFDCSDFEEICSWSRLAPRRNKPAASRRSVLQEAERLGVSPADAAELGVRCRALIDTGRAIFLRSRGFNADLVQHVDFRVTADNIMIRAVRVPFVHAGRDVALASTAHGLADAMCLACASPSEEDSATVMSKEGCSLV